MIREREQGHAKRMERALHRRRRFGSISRRHVARRQETLDPTVDRF
jgi:hypothetical protein